MDKDPNKLPMWTGAPGHSRETWEAWRLAIAGYAGGEGLYLCYDRNTPHRAFGQQQRQQISAGCTKCTNATHSSCFPSWYKLRGGQQSHDASTTATPTAGKLGCNWNA